MNIKRQALPFMNACFGFDKPEKSFVISEVNSH